MSHPDDRPVAALEQALGYRFDDLAHLELALTHRSFANEQPEPPPHNERLEFLGDAVLSLVVGHLLMEQHADWPEGELSKARSRLVSEAGLADLAQGFGLGEFLRLGRGEARSGGRTRPSVLADAMEAVAAAIFLDAGYARSNEILRGWFTDRVEGLDVALRARDPKTSLQELVQGAQKLTPTYSLVDTAGPDHELCFTVQLCIDDRPIALGSGRSKKEAEQSAAAAVLARIDAGERLEAISLDPDPPVQTARDPGSTGSQDPPDPGQSPGEGG
jgi:ribonuclease III